MMGIPVEGPAFVYGDNQSVLVTTTKPGLMLKKKSITIAHRFIRERCSRVEWITTYVNTHENVADLFTKALACTGETVEICPKAAPPYVRGWWTTGIAGRVADRKPPIGED